MGFALLIPQKSLIDFSGRWSGFINIYTMSKGPRISRIKELKILKIIRVNPPNLCRGCPSPLFTEKISI